MNGNEDAMSAVARAGEIVYDADTVLQAGRNNVRDLFERLQARRRADPEFRNIINENGDWA